MSKIYANPFRWGKPVSGDHYIARPNEQEQISTAVEKQIPLVITGYRGSGKTSLINQHIEKSHVVSIYVNLKFVVSRTDLINHFLLALENKFPVISQNEVFNTLKSNKGDSTFTSLFDLLHDLAKQKGENFIVIWDEFHHVVKIKDNIISELRKHMRNKLGVTHIFASHRQDLLRDIFDAKQNLFFSRFEYLTIHNIDDQSFNHYLTRQFRQMGLSDFDLAQKVLGFTKGQPQLTQKFAHSLAQLWLEGTSTRLVEQTLNKMLIEHDALFTSFWDILGLNERRLLLGLADGHSRPTELGFIKKYRLSATSTAHNTTLKLLREGWLISRDEGYYIHDPLFLNWLQNPGKSA